METSHKFAIGMATIERKDCLSKCLYALREKFPEVPIYVADQNGNQGNIELYRLLNVQPLWLEWDAGVSKARNSIFRTATEDYILLIDDDDVLSDDCDENLINDLCALLSENSDWLVIGGQMEERPPFHYNFSRDPQDNSVLVLEESFRAHTEEARGKQYDLIEADSVLNLALFARTRLVGWGLFWDETFKIMEHLDFYLSARAFREKSNQARIFYCGELSGRTLPERRGKDYDRIRFRWRYRNILARKWNLTQSERLAEGRSRRAWLSRDHVWAHALKKCSDALTSLDVNWWVSNGTLLGIVREGNFIVHDPDMDVTVQVGIEEISKVEKAILNAGFTISKSWGLPGEGLEWALKFPQPEGAKWQFGKIKIDVFFADVREDGLTVSAYKGSQVRQVRYPHPQLKSHHVEAWGFDVQVPAETEGFLEVEYGPEWRVPVEKWDYWTSPQNISSGPTKAKRFRPSVYRFFLYLRASDFESWLNRTRKHWLIDTILRKLRISKW